MPHAHSVVVFIPIPLHACIRVLLGRTEVLYDEDCVYDSGGGAHNLCQGVVESSYGPLRSDYFQFSRCHSEASIIGLVLQVGGQLGSQECVWL